MRNRKLRLKIIEVFDSQANFAQAARIHEPLVSRIVLGREKLSPEKQEQWASILGCKREEIFEG